ncbi:MAG: DUF2523 domain-containing protein [Burkholderiales bacterium]|nr:DUF2523 domain-containing protein [Burkholderiales bacterium]
MIQEWIAALLGGLVEIAKSVVGRVMLALGFGYATFTGFDVMIDGVKDTVLGALGSMESSGVQVSQVLASLRIGQAVSLIFAAITTKLFMSGLMGGVIARWVLGRGGVQSGGGEE